MKVEGLPAARASCSWRASTCSPIDLEVQATNTWSATTARVAEQLLSIERYDALRDAYDHVVLFDRART
jgi:hypothetical protein